jgi:hypothetical protein
MVVIEDAYPHAVTGSENLPACLNMDEKATGKVTESVGSDDAAAGWAHVDMGSGSLAGH